MTRRRDRERPRSTFDQVAELYDRARPRYPAALFDDLAELAGIGPGSKVLEIGPGTGQALTPSGPDSGLGTGGQGRTTASVPAVRPAGLAS
jgi:hypothetical protein